MFIFSFILYGSDFSESNLLVKLPGSSVKISLYKCIFNQQIVKLTWISKSRKILELIPRARFHNTIIIRSCTRIQNLKFFLIIFNSVSYVTHTPFINTSTIFIIHPFEIHYFTPCQHSRIYTSFRRIFN